MIQTQSPPSADVASLLRDLGRGSQHQQDLDADVAQTLFASMLEGTVPPLELGAILLAYRFKGETVAELTGFMAALQGRLARMQPPDDRPRPIVLPTYNGARRLPNLTALLALLLKRYGVPVLLHGMADQGGTFGRVTTAAILRELGIEPATSVVDADRRLDADSIAYAPIDLLSPALATLLALRGRMGLRSSAHTVAKLVDPFGGEGVRVVCVSHPEHLTRMHELLVATNADALLLRGTEGEPFANPRRQPRLEWFQRGIATVLFDAEVGTLATPPELPTAIDAPTTAAWIAAALAGKVPIPKPILNQLACCMHATRRLNAEVET